MEHVSYKKYVIASGLVAALSGQGLLPLDAEAQEAFVQVPPAIRDVAMEAGRIHSIDPLLILAIAYTESRFNRQAVGKLGEVGLMQLRPEFFPGVTSDVRQNIYTGTKYLAFLRETCSYQDEQTWIVCFNVGAYHTSLRNPKQFAYYKKVMEVYRRLAAQEEAHGTEPMPFVVAGVPYASH